jgi:hypothetical protein
MDLTEANAVSDEIIAAFKENNNEKPDIEIQNNNGEYAVCIKNFLGATRKQIVTEIAQKHELKASEESEGLTLS